VRHVSKEAAVLVGSVLLGAAKVVCSETPPHKQILLITHEDGVHKIQCNEITILISIPN
jgi:hypothetical protein